MGRWSAAAMLLLCLILSCPAVAVDSAPARQHGLEGGRFLVLGDSYTAGYGLDSPEQDWSYLLAERYHMTQLNYSISGSSFAAGPQGYYPMAERCLTLPEDDALDFVLLQGGSNDWADSIPLGQEDSRETDTFCGAFNLILDVLQEKYPQTPVVCFTPWISDGTRNDAGATAQDYTDAMLSICRSRNILCYDASNAEENGMYLNSEAFRAEYCLSARDWYHLNAQGHAMFAPVFAGWLEEALYGAAPADRFYDLAGADASLRNAVSQLSNVLSGTGSHLFSPTQLVTRELLAQTLYRLAGSPAAPDYPLADLSPDTETYSAVCWAMDAGIFTPSDRFRPDQFVTREMLAATLYRYDTEYLGHFPGSLVGIGSYSDGSAVADYAQVSMGWALSCGILTDLGGALKPQACVSRGSLAQALSTFQNLV